MARRGSAVLVVRARALAGTVVVALPAVGTTPTPEGHPAEGIISDWGAPISLAAFLILIIGGLLTYIVSRRQRRRQRRRQADQKQA